MARIIYTLHDHLNESLKDPVFKKEWEASEVEYQVSRQIISERLRQHMTQKELAKKVNTTQAVISRIEHMTENVSMELLKRIATAFGTRVKVQFE
ncbi:hypothetical protein A3A63_03670 [Candidatus Gottesmanbacteria bacterium RIFCSPLOWO2_01_FULL_46_9]|uniref:HTH cro/C1-type domain-containing protein n=1 Tax=Candidatus Gottesmanbacteria bacterium RIFCSPLOWO2_01_FULL_46_9 TaxID=1798394 RepID=A0A1F6AX59_9BACT|nr:MAG: hypothetical protein A3A63_03670 [Candidatus Gottesmanbacteria bacterium RIFCSPLOWO2_01_FULL_46_9]